MVKDYELKYLQILAKDFRTVQEVSTELINLTAILNLPKGTEHFLSDIHGEYDTFNHFIKNGSGVIREKIDLLFTDMSEKDKNQLAFFIFYPKQMIKKYQEIIPDHLYNDFLRTKLLDLIKISRLLSQKYTKSKVRKTLPKPFAYIIQELMYENQNTDDKHKYYNSILDAIFKTNREKIFLHELADFIQRLTIDRLHIVGDIFDRGPAAHLIMGKISNYHSVDIEWGNHDIIWMGASCGSKLSICNVIRNSARYNTLDTLEEGYGINLLPLASFANKYYKNDNCELFTPINDELKIDNDKKELVAKMHKAIAIIQFKLEGSVIKRNPNFKLDDRLLLHKINPKTNTITIDGKEYSLLDSNFPTIDWDDPYKMIQEEYDILVQLKGSFLNNDILHKHMKTMFQNGHMYLKYNNNLLYHGCVPLNSDGSFMELEVNNYKYKGRELFDFLDSKVRSSYMNRDEKRNYDKDYFVFLWQSELSPLFGKDSMKTFERYFIKEKIAHKERMNDYFILREQPHILQKIYNEFDLDFKLSKIINGHVPIDISVGDNPIKADGKIYSIDGGMSKAYKKKINIGGYTLISDSYKLSLVSHERFPSLKDLIKNEKDIISLVQSTEINDSREYIYSTDKGMKLQEEINDLYKLLDCYHKGIIKEHPKKDMYK